MSESAWLKSAPMAKTTTYDHETSSASVTGKLVCPEHGTPLVCPTCNGMRGGKQTSEAKTAAARANAKRPRPGARGKKKPRKKKA